MRGLIVQRTGSWAGPLWPASWRAQVAASQAQARGKQAGEREWRHRRGASALARDEILRWGQQSLGGRRPPCPGARDRRLFLFCFFFLFRDRSDLARLRKYRSDLLAIGEMPTLDRICRVSLATAALSLFPFFSVQQIGSMIINHNGNHSSF
jgi:hypothetical protein